MIINDAVYGKQKITDKCALEIIKTKAFQRLKGIKQAGITSHVLKERKITRHEHCLGAYFLLRRFKASREEQIAGLLHDLPHTAFSHVADFVFSDGKENYHEKIHRKLLIDSGILEILKKHGFKPERFFDDKNFKLLEQPVPELCADRMDYFLRDSLELGMDFRRFISNIKVFHGKFVFNDEHAALHFAVGFKTMNELVWENAYETALYVVASDILKMALKKGVIDENDFLKTDNELIEKIKKSDNYVLRSYLASLEEFADGEGCEQKSIFKVSPRGRHIDPLVLKKGKLFRLSHLNKSYKALILLYKENMKRGYNVRVKRI